MSQLVFSIHCNPEEVGSNASEGMDLLARQEQAGKEQNFLPPCPYTGFQRKSVAQVTCDLKIWIKGMHPRLKNPD